MCFRDVGPGGDQKVKRSRGRPPKYAPGAAPYLQKVASGRGRGRPPKDPNAPPKESFSSYVPTGKPRGRPLGSTKSKKSPGRPRGSGAIGKSSPEKKPKPSGRGRGRPPKDVSVSKAKTGRPRGRPSTVRKSESDAE